jgi:hypothetical protein
MFLLAMFYGTCFVVIGGNEMCNGVGGNGQQQAFRQPLYVHRKHEVLSVSRSAESYIDDDVVIC